MSAVQRSDRNPTRRVTKIGPATVRQRFGAVILVAVIAIVVAIELWPNNNPTPPPDELTVVNGFGGGLKVDFLSDPAVTAILAERYGLRVEIIERGSNEIACDTPLVPEDDFVWLGDSVVLELHKSCGGIVRASENIYYSPIVLYSWAPVVDALVAAGVAHHQADGSFSLDFARLVEMIEGGQPWASLGMPQLNGTIAVQTSDPRDSNSGLLFSGLLANTLNGGGVVDTATVDPLLSRLQKIILKGGYMPDRSSDLWNLYISTGMGAYPIVALYESQVIEHIVAYPGQLEQINRDVRILYPEPTVWATHPFVARTPEGEKLLNALKDPEIQAVAASRHGQRPSVASVPFDPSVTGIRDQVTSVSGMPGPEVMDKILVAIDAVPIGPAPAPVSSPIAGTDASLAWLSSAARRDERARRHRASSSARRAR